MDGILSCKLGLFLNFGARQVEVKQKVKGAQGTIRLSCHPVKKGFSLGASGESTCLESGVEFRKGLAR